MEYVQELKELSVFLAIEKNIDITKITGENFSYIEFIEIMNLLRKNYLLEGVKKVEITELGYLYYERLKKIVKNKGNFLVIPQFQYLTRKIDKFDVYLDE